MRCSPSGASSRSCGCCLITDPVNERYGTARVAELQLLRAAGVEVVLGRPGCTARPELPVLESWRLTLHWWDGPPGALGALARELNFKADHRKVIIADDGANGLAARGRLRQSIRCAERLVERCRALLRRRRAHAARKRAGHRALLGLARRDGSRCVPAANAPSACDAQAPPALTPASARVQVLTEGAIRRELLEQLGAAVQRRQRSTSPCSSSPTAV